MYRHKPKHINIDYDQCIKHHHQRINLYINYQYYFYSNYNYHLRFELYYHYYQYYSFYYSTTEPDWMCTAGVVSVWWTRIYWLYGVCRRSKVYDL